MLAVQLRHEVQATRAAGIRSKRFVVTALLALCLVALVVLGIVGAFHGGPGFEGGGPGFEGGGRGLGGAR
jgi:hypothetical protein